MNKELLVNNYGINHERYLVSPWHDTAKMPHDGPSGRLVQIINHMCLSEDMVGWVITGDDPNDWFQWATYSVRKSVRFYHGNHRVVGAFTAGDVFQMWGDAPLLNKIDQCPVELIEKSFAHHCALLDQREERLRQAISSRDALLDHEYVRFIDARDTDNDPFFKLVREKLDPVWEAFRQAHSATITRIVLEHAVSLGARDISILSDYDWKGFMFKSNNPIVGVFTKGDLPNDMASDIPLQKCIKLLDFPYGRYILNNDHVLELTTEK